MSQKPNAPRFDTHPDYWEEYTNFQNVKHFIIKRYLSGWFNIMATRNGRILYFDTHAGRGRHETGELGSPLVALHALLNHRLKDQILSQCEVIFYFVEIDPANFKHLKEEISSIGELPEKIKLRPIGADSFSVLKEILRDLRSRNAQLAPAFFFIDPYGISIPGDLLHELMQYPKVELFVNIIWRELDAQMHQQGKPGVSENIDKYFRGEEWRDIIETRESDERANKAINLLRKKIDALWATYIFMMRDHSAIRYILLHLTNHDKGRDLIKDCLWSICPHAQVEGSFFARKTEDYRQMQLLSAEPDLSPLFDWCKKELEGGPRRWQEIIDDLRSELWIESQLNKVIRDMRKNGVIKPSDFTGRFSGKRNPLLELA